jgi:TolB-like protein
MRRRAPLARRAPRPAAAAAAAVAIAIAACAPPPPAFVAGDLPAGTRVAMLPLMNLTERQDAADRLMPVMLSELARRPGVEVVDAGAVEAAIAQEPWLLLDRIPPDLVDRFGEQLGARALLVGTVLAYGYREHGGDRVPELSVSLRLLESPGGRQLWSVSYARDGRDRERLFGIGRVESLDRLVNESMREVLATFPDVAETRIPPKEDTT